MTTGLNIAQALDRPHNGFGALRLALALAVVVSHAGSVVSGDPFDEPLTRSTGFTLGEHAVNGFFAVSGFLVTMSFARRGARAYVVARARRILPGLVAAVLAVSLGLGPALTRLPLAEYLTAPELGRFLLQTLTGLKSSATLPGLFEASANPSVLGTIWTLRYEMFCYLGVLALGAAGLRGRASSWASSWASSRARPISLFVLALVVGLGLALVAAELSGPLSKATETRLRLPLIFALGAGLYLWRNRVRLSAWPLLGLAAAWLLRETPLYRSVLFASEAYLAIWLALRALPALRIFDPPADLSYGVYLYGWPIQQALHASWPDLAASWLLAFSILIVLPVAAVSWFLVEKPALGSKARLRGTIQPAGP